MEHGKETPRLSGVLNRTTYFDALNILATISVVWIHFGNEVHWYDGSRVWYWCLFIQVICYWAVPVFFMLTGATLLNYRAKYTTKEFFARRLKKTLLPYLVFGTLLTLFGLCLGSLTINSSHPLISIMDIFINNRMESIYWFFLVLLGIYLAMPGLSVFAKEENRVPLNYLVFVGILTISVFPFLSKALQQCLGVWENTWNAALELPILGSYLLYPVLGYWAATYDFKKKERIMCYAAAITCAILRFVGLMVLSQRDGTTNQLFMDYKSFPALFLALGVFVFAKYLFRQISIAGRARKVLKELSACSFGVYLIHHIVLDVMAKIPFFAKYSFQWYFFWPFVCYLACLCFVYIVRKIPIIKNIFP